MPFSVSLNLCVCVCSSENFLAFQPRSDAADLEETLESEREDDENATRVMSLLVVFL